MNWLNVWLTSLALLGVSASAGWSQAPATGQSGASFAGLDPQTVGQGPLESTNDRRRTAPQRSAQTQPHGRVARRWSVTDASRTLVSETKPLKPQRGKPTNVLFIAVDDMRAELGCYGASHVKSPNLDSLAGRSLVFERAYCQQSVCNPSRASIMTGLDIDTLGIYNLQTHFREVFPDIVTLPQHFKNHGYQSHGIGKLFHNYRQQFEGDDRSWDSPQLLHYGNHNLDFAKVDGELPPDMVPIPRAEKRDVPDNAYLDGQIADLAVNRLREIKDAPFFLGVGFWKPHLPFNAPAKYWDMYDRSDLQLPSIPNPPENVPAIALHGGRELLRDFDNGLDEHDTLTMRHGYYAAISYVDAQIGKVLDELDRLGLRDQTIVVLWSDHGFHLGEHDLWCKNSCFELDAQVPMMIRVPGMTDHSPRTNALVELVDLYPTLADLCGLPISETLDGFSLRPVLEDPKATVRSFALNQNPRPIIPADPNDIKAMGYSIRSQHHRYTSWRDPADGSVVAAELYDHQIDPMETRNVAGQAAYAAIEAQHREWLSSRMK